MTTHLISGGARSGKSRFAEALAHAHVGPVTYIATAQVRDGEFGQRVAHHQARRPPAWALLESGRDLAAVLQAGASADALLLVDCLGMWLMRFFGDDGLLDEPAFAAEKAALLAALPALPGTVLLVSNETGWGVVAADAMTRRFVDELGRLNQDVAAVCERVTLVACGLPLVLKTP
ncbi:bifunctional adenosylcobinamide kinase/adenosylcobinamide-phosphate guanylyltransferase [Craterilacuibacter sp. RT1T]|uniref:bifunctional adenosylcobinamide kinase/adenosylcobinamide-phosphate guanylyltransferase n=1 Tax=Craterilacuibacter sp. RT1T TaxID=2942211 RepID=UPI0020BF773B|nr:bifunctional adenosylcobinamide kinase/adenosylcobinamide-phosphate guanylyltransferase [Craterilacuibacter sp. RT1T]MCL6264201.1 bifunctional adenosylcobinamide kinase/adenosylcobinamide-phosphate guanylyltransferase [Craterilacuibacter sp. RT1T]